MKYRERTGFGKPAKADDAPDGNVYFDLNAYAANTPYGHKGAYAGKVKLQKLADASGVSRSTLFYISRHPSRIKCLDFRTIGKLCRALNCQPGDIIKWEPVATRPGVGYDATAYTLDDLPGAE